MNGEVILHSQAVVAQWLECPPVTRNVAGSNPVNGAQYNYPSILKRRIAMCAQSYFEALDQEYDEPYVSQHSKLSTGTLYQSPSEVAGRDETKVALTQWEENLLNAVKAGDTVALPTDLFEDLVEIAEEYSDSIRPSFLVEKTPNYKHSRIRVQLSRPLTVAEREKLNTDHHIVGGRLNVSRRRDDGFLFKLRVSPNGTHVWVDADLPSRLLFDVLAAALDQHFVNVYPTAVRTFTEYHA